MKKHILFQTNFFVCIIIALGFIITSIISYQSNMGLFEKDVAQVSDLAADSIYYKIDSMFTTPINVSLTMANDNLMKDFLSDEEDVDDAKYLKSMRDYLYAYHKKYNYDSVFLISAKTSRYYHYNGVDRILTEDNPENKWYYDFLGSSEEYSLNIDNDEAANNEIAVFINCKINDSEGRVMGIVGVGFYVNALQELLDEYEDEFGVQARLVNGTGKVEISTQHTGYENVNLFDNGEYEGLKEQLLSVSDDAQSFWNTSVTEKGYIVSRYVKNMDWYLIVENNTSNIQEHLQIALVKAIIVIIIIMAVVLFTITTAIRRYNARIIELTSKQEREHYAVRQNAAKELYENIYELDITHNRAAGENTEYYFESLGIPSQTPYDEAIEIIAEKQIKEEYRQGYVSTFSPDNILDCYRKGIKSLTYDFMITNDGENYYWMRIMASIYYWSEDHSIRMTSYHQNIDAEKRQEAYLRSQMKKDPLTGLYNKAATEEMSSEIMTVEEPGRMYAFFMLDIDDFKATNDTMGHAAGDYVISCFSQNLKSLFRKDDIVGRVGGDEFAAFVPIPSIEWAEKKAAAIVAKLHETIVTDAGTAAISISMGIAVYPDMGTDFETLYKNADLALYHTKQHGKNGYTIYDKSLSK